MVEPGDARLHRLQDLAVIEAGDDAVLTQLQPVDHGQAVMAREPPTHGRVSASVEK
jgi:hypothetical protein